MESGRRRFLTLLGAAGLSACAPRPLAGRDVELTPLRSYSALEGRILVGLADVKGVTVRNGVDCYRVTYPTHDGRGRPVRATGLMALPQGDAPRGLVSFQHGTTTTRSAAPSNRSGDGVAAALVFGGAGHAVVAPDYLGLGGSGGVHPYLVAELASRAVVDLIAAVRRIPGVPQSPPFLMGFSQGGHASLAAQRTMEAAGQPVRGVAAVAGPHNLRTISFPNALAGGAASHSLYLAYTARGYADHYGQPLESLVSADWSGPVRDLFGRPHRPEEIVAGLPRRPRDLFTPEFLAAYDGGGRHWFLDALAANEVAGFVPRAPMRLYYGSSDVDVPPREALVTAARMQARGADARAIDLGPVGHDPSAVAAAPLVADWLESLG